MPVQRLPMPVTDGPARPTAAGPSTVPASAPPLPAVQAAIPRAPAQSAGAAYPDPVPPPPGVSAAAGAASRAALQRAVSDAGISGVPVTAVPARPPAAPGGSAGNRSARETRTSAPPAPGPDMEELARKLLEPVSRLLRADMRRGLERTGRLYDGRR
ncbi:hypothetical protein ACIOYT_04170 [Streptomyces halstedii]|uniref:hypothetical protein n=1 Tax=Streptomyces halstedii TaxID=1944 RepID=UPI00381A47DB